MYVHLLAIDLNHLLTENTEGNLDTQVTDAVPQNFNTLIIATSVVACVATISVATIIGICVLAAVQCRRHTAKYVELMYHREC